MVQNRMVFPGMYHPADYDFCFYQYADNKEKDRETQLHYQGA